jgi:hypothetical protein
MESKVVSLGDSRNYLKGENQRPLEPSDDRTISTLPLVLFLTLLVAGQIALAAGAFRSLSDLRSDRPVINVDWCSQFYWSHAARHFQAQNGRLWGYDPYFMAGYPLDFVFNSSLPVQMAAAALPRLNLAPLIKDVIINSLASAAQGI